MHVCMYVYKRCTHVCMYVYIMYACMYALPNTGSRTGRANILRVRKYVCMFVKYKHTYILYKTYNTNIHTYFLSLSIQTEKVSTRFKGSRFYYSPTTTDPRAVQKQINARTKAKFVVHTCSM